MKNKKPKVKAVKAVKAWAITCYVCDEDLKICCQYEMSLSIYQTKEGAEKEMLAADGTPKCTGDFIIPVLITPLTPKGKKR